MSMRTKPTVKPFTGRIGFPPFVDVFFLLLIFFIVGSSFVFHPGIPVDLPTSAKLSPGPAEKIVVTVTDQDQLFLNDESVSWEELEQKLVQIVHERSGQFASAGSRRSPKIIIRADQKISYGKIVRIMAFASSQHLGSYLVIETEENGLTE
jgi:biopolymer transport protein ExbD